MHIRLIRAVRLTQRLANSIKPVYDAAFQQRISRLSARMGLRRQPTIGMSPELHRPAVVGVAAPVIVIPERVFLQYGFAEIEKLLVYQIIHLRRSSFTANFFQWLMEAALFFHPAVWLISAMVRRARESAIGDEARREGGEPFPYTDQLVRRTQHAAGGGLHVPPDDAAMGDPIGHRPRLLARENLSPDYDGTMQRLFRSTALRLYLVCVITALVLVYTLACTPASWPLRLDLTPPANLAWGGIPWDSPIDLELLTPSGVHGYDIHLRSLTLTKLPGGLIEAQYSLQYWPMRHGTVDVDITLRDETGAVSARGKDSVTIDARLTQAEVEAQLLMAEEHVRTLLLTVEGAVERSSLYAIELNSQWAQERAE
jgi:hypothetical protein